TTFFFKENPLLILCLISYILTRVIRDNAIFINSYTSIKPFFNTDLKDAGSEDLLTSYYFRRSLTNTINNI
ncbi:hypothetical protein BKA65DRAFT_376956, partial [Rhexocercosporidium sp. MPI-PUGE-AT-0058]